MLWTVCFVTAVATVIFSIIAAFAKARKKYKKGTIFKPANILVFGVVLSSVILFIPIYANVFKNTSCGGHETLIIAIHNVIRLFVVDGDFDFVTDNLVGASAQIKNLYTLLFSLLFVAAPVFTFNFVLSFFKNISAYRKYFLNFRLDAFIFSELNEKSLALAESLYESDSKRRMFVFTDVFEKEEEQSYELIERAKELGAICFKKDIVTVNFAFHSKKSELSFFAIGEDQSENINQALKIIGNSNYKENCNLYVFSTQIEAEILLANAFNEGKSSGIRVRRVNEVRSLISRTLYDTGYENIFQKAADNVDENGVKRINAAIIGMGLHGAEMTKALAWLCQMDGYLAEINCFDIDPLTEERFVSLCPELMDSSYNGVFDVEGEAKYKISIHSGIDVYTKRFDDTVLSLPKTTYIFVALGNDEKNISTAIKLRSMFARKGYEPVIQAVVYNTDKIEALEDIKNFKKQAYNIDFIGDMKSSYSKNVILDLDVEKKALERHKKWGDEKEFWQYDYNYKSSVASAIHYEMKVKCEISGIEKLPADRTEEERWAIRTLEHCRWNAYMRSEGYVYSGSTDKRTRNDLAKIHHCLVPFKDLSAEEQIKDDD